MIETHRLKNVVIFFETILSFVLSRKIYQNSIRGFLLNCELVHISRCNQ